MKKEKLIILSMILLTACSLTSCGVNVGSNSESIDTNKYYTVTWKDYDDSILEVDKDVLEGSTPSYDGKTPTRDDSEQFKYTFDKWSPEIKEVTEDVTYTAVYKSTLTKAKVIFDLDGGASASYVTNKYMDSITPENFFFDVVKEDYNFRGWSYNGDKVFDNKGNQLSNPALEETMVFTAIFAQTVELTIKKSIENAGTVTGEGEYSFNTYVDLKAVSDTGYVFVGWYYEGTLLSNQPDYKYMLWNNDVILEARFRLDSYLLEVESYNEDLGLVMIKDSSYDYSTYAKQRYDYTTKVSIAAYTKTSEYTFLGWFDDNGELVETDLVYTFTMPNHDYKLIAKWDLFNLSLKSNIDGAGVLTGAGDYKSNSDVTINATANNGYTFVGWYDNNGSLISQNQMISIKVLLEDLSYTAKFSTNSYAVNVSSEDTSKGTVTGSGSYEYMTMVTIMAITNDGYSFEGWYDGETLISNESVFTFTMPFININYVAKFSTNSYLATAVSESSSKGSVTGTGSYLYKSSVTFVATPNKGYSFIGWFDGDNLISSDSEYAFEIPCADVSYTAKFSTNSYAVNVSSEDTSKGTVTGSGIYEYGTIVTLSVAMAKTTLDNPYKISFTGWYKNDQLLSTDESYSFVMPSEDLNVVGKFDFVSLTTGDIIYYGNYPQSIVYDSSLKNILTEKAGTLPTSDDSLKWTPYNWYISSSNETKYAWYIDLDIDEDGQNDYRGVYFTSYRPYCILDESSSFSSKQYENGYRISNIYWFKYEPLEWRILNNNEGDYLAMSNKIIDCEQYSVFSSRGEVKTKVDYQGNSSSAYPNNYQFSDLRTFLNVDFYNSAFSVDEQKRILTTIVDNSASSTGNSSNVYACENTEDKIFALSYQEVTNPSYGLDNSNPDDDETRKLMASDYAMCKGVHRNISYGHCYGSWWLRSPSHNSAALTGCVDYFGSAEFASSSDFAANTYTGVVPALCLR